MVVSFFLTIGGGFKYFAYILGGGFKYFFLSPLFGEDSHFDEHIFQMGWFNHQPGSLSQVVVSFFFLKKIKIIQGSLNYLPILGE